MATRKPTEFNERDSKLARLHSRLRLMYADRERIEGELRKAGVKPDMRAMLQAKLAALQERIKSAEMQESDPHKGGAT